MTTFHESVWSGNSTYVEFPLIAKSRSGHFASPVIHRYRIVKGAVEGSWANSAAADQVGLPFQVSAWELVVAGERLHFEDYTEGCAGLGISLFPGQDFSLPPVALPAHLLEACAHACSIRVRVWGHL